jgi:hypothetical protein
MPRDAPGSFPLKPVDQTLFGEEGNCRSACVASLLELSISEVPLFIAKGKWSWQQAEDLFLAKHGMQALRQSFFQNGNQPYDDVTWGRCYAAADPGRFFILSGISPRKDSQGRTMRHAVVGQADGYGFKVIHDPHPSRDGLVGHPFGITFLYPRAKG